MNIGKVVQVIGPVVDVAFDEKNLPPIYTAVRITSEGFEVPAPIDIVTEVQQHLGEGRVRAVARTCPSWWMGDSAPTPGVLAVWPAGSIARCNCCIANRLRRQGWRPTGGKVAGSPGAGARGAHLPSAR